MKEFFFFLDYYLEDLEWQQANYYFVSKPIPIPEAGSLSHILSNFDIFQYRLGKELVWMGNFENEGSSLWNLNSNSESLHDSIYRRGSSSISHLRSSISPGNIITNLENKFPYKSHLEHTLHGKIKTENGKNVNLEIRLSENRTSGTIINESLNSSINGDNDWKEYWKDISNYQEVNFFDIVMNSGVPILAYLRHGLMILV